jgi:myo-inositol 2-dehydrogenase/D-chiro-inositol 1-dehydrogenase
MNQESNQPENPSRRNFIKTSSVAVAGGLLLPRLGFQSFGAANTGPLKIGLVGCGGRGTGAAGQALNADKNVVLAAAADVFQDRLQIGLDAIRGEANVRDKVKVQPDHCFVGLDAYQKLLASDVDVVILATPPGFRPTHLKAAIAAGKHVFCEKPMAVDAPGLRTVLAAAEEAKKKQLSLASGFCWRSHYPKRETFSRVLDGAIGKIQTIYSTYNTGPVKEATLHGPGWSDLEKQLRNWYQFAWLSGDHIVEQAVHSLDMMSWAMGDTPPVRATAVGGRQVRTSWGHIYDHFGVTYEYENGARGLHQCRQQSGCSNDYSVHMAGTKGNCTVDCSRNQHIITGDNAWRYASKAPVIDMYQVEHNEFFASIRSGNLINHGKWMAQSTLTAIMGRMAAYTGQTITWEQALNSQETLAPEKIEWDAMLTVPPVPMPGVTKLV